MKRDIEGQLERSTLKTGVAAFAGVFGFTLDRDTGSFLLTHEQVRIPADTGEFAMTSALERIDDLDAVTVRPQMIRIEDF